DRDGFGRREQTLSASDVIQLLSTQIDDLLSLAGEEGAKLKYVKPHGALYNQAQREPQVARAVVESIRSRGWPLLGQPGTILETIAREQGVPFIAEGFPDRRYRADGSLVPRREANALLHEPHEIEQQVLRLIESGRVATLCVHGDEPGAVATAALIRRVLTA